MADFKALLKRYDQQDMQGCIKRIPEQFLYAAEDAAFPAIAPVAATAPLVLAGLGGSALPADILLAAYARELQGRFQVVRDYQIAFPIGPATTVIAASFSGNTEETIAAYRQARAARANVVAITAGGELARLARQDRAPLVVIPKAREGESFQPRLATGYFFTYLSRMLHALGVIADPVPALRELAADLKAQRPVAAAKKAALAFQGKIPVFWAPERYANAVARILKIKINENSKAPAFWNVLPEANHNEMIGYRSAIGKYHVVLLEDADGDPAVALRMKILPKVFRARKLNHVEFCVCRMEGPTPLHKIFRTLLWGEWVSLFLAVLYHVDPTPVELVEDFKHALVQQRQ